MDKPSNEVKAIHEAGHAVANVIVGLGCSGVTIVESVDEDGNAIGGSAGSDTIPAFETGCSEDVVLPWMIVKFAGAAAERCFYGTSTPGGDSEDRKHAAMMAVHPHRRDFGPDSSPRYSELDTTSRDLLLVRAEAEAETLVGRHRRAIRALADRLVQSLSVPREEVARIVDAHPAGIDGPPSV